MSDREQHKFGQQIDMTRLSITSRIVIRPTPTLLFGQFGLQFSRDQSTATDSTSANGDESRVFAPKDSFCDFVVSLRNVCRHLFLAASRVLFKGKDILSQATTFTKHTCPAIDHLLICIEQQRFSRLADGLQLSGRSKDKIERMPLGIPPAVRDTVVRSNCLHFVKQTLPKRLKQALCKNGSLPGRRGLGDEAMNAEAQSDGSRRDRTDSRPRIPICSALGTQQPAFGKTIQHAHSLSPSSIETLFARQPVGRRHAMNSRAAEIPQLISLTYSLLGSAPTQRRTSEQACFSDCSAASKLSKQHWGWSSRSWTWAELLVSCGRFREPIISANSVAFSQGFPTLPARTQAAILATVLPPRGHPTFATSDAL